MRDFLLYNVWGGIAFNIPFAALAAFIGWKLTNAVLRKSNLKKRTLILISLPVIVAIFVGLKSLAQ